MSCKGFTFNVLLNNIDACVLSSGVYSQGFVLHPVKHNRNKKQINEYLNRGNENEKTLNPVQKEDVLNINDVHSMSYGEVKKIIDDYNRDEKFGIDRPKVLTKNYISKTK